MVTSVRIRAYCLACCQRAPAARHWATRQIVRRQRRNDRSTASAKDEYPFATLWYAILCSVHPHQDRMIALVIRGCNQAFGDFPIAWMKKAVHILENKTVRISLVNKPPELPDKLTPAVKVNI